MAKALIIKGADFSANYVTRITIASVPCTGIQFAQSEITISGSDTATVEYTVTPQDTTDPVIWESSDTNVVTVSKGVLTVVGIGTATITATCGNYSASAEVTTSVGYIRNYQFYQTTNASGKTYLSASYARSRLSAFGTGEQEGSYLVPDSTSGGSAILHPIKIPRNAARIRIIVGIGTNFYNAADSAIHWLRDESSGDSSLPNAALYVESTTFNPRTETPLTVSVPNGADCFVAYFKLSSKQADEVVANKFASDSGISIEFLTE